MAATGPRPSGRRPTSRAAVPDGGDGGRGGSVYLRVDAGQTTLRDFQSPPPLQGDARRSRHAGAAPRQGRRRPGPRRPARHGRLRRRDRRARRRPRRGRPAGDGRARRPRRARQHPLQDLDPPGAQARPEGRARRGALAPARAAAHRRHRPGRAAQRRQVHAARGGHRRHAEDRRLPVHDARAEPRRAWTSATRTSGGRRSPTCPGLIEGASGGAGLGHAFLRHVERTRVLVHVVDGSSRDPAWDYDVIREELRAHDPALLDKPMLVAFNKLDLPAAAEAWPAFQRGREADGLVEVVAISAATRRGPRRLPRTDRGDAARRRRRWPSRPSRPASSSTASRPWPTASRSSVDADGALPRPRRADRADRRPDQLRRRGVGRALPARPGPAGHRRRAAARRHRSRRPRPDRRTELEWEAQPVGGPVTDGPTPIVPRLRSASSAGPSTRSTSPTSRSPRRRRETLGLERVLFIPAGEPPHKPDQVVDAGRATGWRWSSWRSPATRRFAVEPHASSSAPGRRTRSTR